MTSDRGRTSQVPLEAQTRARLSTRRDMATTPEQHAALDAELTAVGRVVARLAIGPADQQLLAGMLGLTSPRVGQGMCGCGCGRPLSVHDIGKGTAIRRYCRSRRRQATP